MTKTITDRINKFLIEDEDEHIPVNESMLEPNNAQIKPGEYANLSTGLRRIQFRLERANTPQKYVDAFEVINQLIHTFPLKSKAIWQAVSSAYDIRFGSSMSGATPSSGAETEEM